MEMKSAEVNGTKTKSLRTGREMPHRQQKNRARSYSLPGYKCLSMGVLSDDFATVDFREVLCYHSRPKKRKFKRFSERKNNNKKALRGGKSGSRSPKRVSGDGSAPPRISVWFSALFVFAACAWLRRSEATPLVYDKHTPRCQVT